MSLRVRLYLLFLSVGLIAVVAAGAALTALGALDRQQAAERQQFLKEIAVRELEGTLQQAGTEVTAFLAGDEGARNLYEVRAKSARSEIAALLDAAEGADERAGILGLRQEWQRYETAVDKAFYLAKKGPDDRAFRTFRKWIDGKLQPAFRDQVRELVAGYRDRSQESAARAEARGAVAWATVVVCFVALAVVLLSCTFLIRRWIARPLRILTQGTREIARGQYGGVVPITTTDEIGALARDVEAMSRSIADFQRELVERERFAAVGEMTATVAHNIRNPLASIRVLAQSLVRRGDVTAEQAESLKTIMSTVDRADRWLKDLLVELRPVTVARAEEDVAALLEEVGTALGEHARRCEVTIDTRIDPALPRVSCDRRKLNQALVSLVSNAIDAAPAGTVVSLRGLHPAQNGNVEIVVEDRGPGMDAETRQRLFSPSFSTKSNGTGLGLSLVQRIVFGHDGRIAVDSSPGEGCRMRVTLPVGSEVKKDHGTDTHT